LTICQDPFCENINYLNCTFHYSFFIYMTIRPATINDLETLYRFEQGVVLAERPFDSTLKNEKIHYYDIEGMIVAPHIELLVAVYNNQLIGSGYARIESAKPYLKHKQHAYLGFMYVEPAFRGKGVNKLIMEELVQWAKEKGITEFRLDVYNDNQPAITAYEKVGFKKHLIEMRMEILL
jgi:GNAT superfamily N-acetyltransferase